MDSVQLAGVALAALLSENFILVNCLGIGTRVEAFHSTTAARRTGLSLPLAMVVTVFFTWCADFLVLRHFGWVYLRTLVFSLIALLTVFLLRKAARLWPELSHRIDADLASVSTNCAVLGAAYLAGLAVGYWSSVEQIRKQWHVDRIFEPTWDEAAISKARDGWEDAVKRTLSSYTK